MEFQKIEQNGEVILVYAPARQAREITLRYECELPRCMTPAEPIASVQEQDASEASPDRKKSRKKKAKAKKRRWFSATALVLSITLSLSCLSVGIWGIFRMIDASSGIPPYTPGNSAGNTQPDNGSNSGNQDGNTIPDWYDGSNKDVSNKGAPNIEVYRPTTNIPQLNLVSVSASRAPLTAGEVYQKVAPSTVTVLGQYSTGYSVGTGVIFTSNGYIVTNYHVIAGCAGCEVWVTNEYGVDSSYTARFVGGDEDQDLAVIKIEAEGLPAAEFGVSSDLSVGDKVYAIGNPLGTELRSTFTDGIVSAVDRNVDVDGVTMTLIQTNTALNSGNSGGPLINSYGQVVGINTIKMMSGEDTIEGLGFAIPSSLAQRWINDILTLGEIRPSPILGISVNRIPTKLSDGTEGLEVLDVTQGLGAQRAGVRAGDVIVAFNGRTVHRVEDIYAERLKLSVGDSVTIRVYRNGEYLDLTMIMMADPG